jgi:hypothetical protein
VLILSCIQNAISVQQPISINHLEKKLSSLCICGDAAVLQDAQGPNNKL